MRAAELIGRAMIELRPMSGGYHARQRSFCPHALGWKQNRSEGLHLFAWQFSGDTSPGQSLPEWRCFIVREFCELRLEHGAWRKGRVTAHGVPSCVDLVGAAVAPEHTAAKLMHLPRAR